MKNELDHFIKTHIVLDESFTGFYHKLAALQIPFTIVSDGFDYIIHRILLLNNIQPPPIYANHLDWAQNQSLSTAKISFPCQRKSSHQYNPGRGLCGNCKTELLHQTREQQGPKKIVYFGDGETDKCASNYVDHVYPRQNSVLHKYCEQKGISHTPFTSFTVILQDIVSSINKTG